MPRPNAQKRFQKGSVEIKGTGWEGTYLPKAGTRAAIRGIWDNPDLGHITERFPCEASLKNTSQRGLERCFLQSSQMFSIWEDSLKHSSLSVLLQLGDRGPERGRVLPKFRQGSYGGAGLSWAPIPGRRVPAGS